MVINKHEPPNFRVIPAHTYYGVPRYTLSATGHVGPRGFDGYDDALTRHGADESTPFIDKPFDFDELRGAVRAAIEGDRGRTGPTV